MKIKKIFSAVLALSMLMPTAAITANAETTVTAQPASGYTISAWPSIWYSSSDEENFPSSNPDRTMDPKVTFDDSRTGESSLYIHFPTENHAYCMNLYTRSDQTVALENGKTYVMGAWMKGMESKTAGTLYLAVGKDKWGGVALASAKETDENGWTLYQNEFTADSDDYSGRVRFYADKVYGDDCTILVDDVFIYEKGSDVNLVDNPSFNAYLPTRTYIPQGRAALRGSQGWQDYTQTDKCTFYAQPVTGEGSVYEGEKAAFVYRTNGYSTVQTNFRYTADEPMPAGKYTISFYLKTKDESASIPGRTFIGPMGIRIDNANATEESQWTKTYAGDDWFKYEGVQDVTLDNNGNVRTEIRFDFDMWVADAAFYLDGLSVKDSSGKEYCSNGGFEDCYVYEDGAPRSFVAYSASSTNAGDGVVAWYNPTRDDITDITLTVNGTEIEFEPDLTSAGYNQVVLENLGEHLTYNCVLNITAGGKVYTNSRVLIPHSSENYYNAAGNQLLNGWSFLRNETEGNYANAVLEVDRDIKYSGNSSMRITGGRSSAVSGVYANLAQSVTLEKNKTYQFSVTYRCVGAKSFNVQGIYNTTNGWENDPTIKSTSVRERWTTKTYTMNAYDGEADDGDTYTRTLQFIIQDNADAIWIDDVAIYEMTEGVADTSKNFVRNGGFEFDDWSISGSEYYLTYEGEVLDQIEALESGEILAQKGFRNVNNENLEVTVVAASYEDGKLIDVSFVDQQIPIAVNPFVSSKVGTTVTVPEMVEGKKYEVKLMVLDSMDNLVPLTQADIFN